MAPDFDAELHLRLVGEDEVLDPGPPGRHPWSSALVEAASALISVGLVTRESAEVIVAQYQRALALRSGGGGHPVAGPLAGGGEPIAAPRVVVVDRELELPSGRIHVDYVALGDRSTNLAASGVEGTGTARAATRYRPRFGGRVAPRSFQATLTDDAGTVQVAHFNGQLSMGSWSGRLTTGQPLSPTTRWIEVDGIRLDLPGAAAEPSAPPVRVERLPDADPAAGYLWLRLATRARGMHHDTNGVDAGLAALVAAGAVDSDGDLATQVRAAAAALSGGRSGSAGWRYAGSPRGGAGQPGPAKPTPLPQPWASLMARASASDGVPGMVPVGVVTPPVDGVVVCVEVVDLAEDGFAAHVVTSPGLVFFGRPSLDAGKIAWWADDDRGNHYLGSPGSWSGSDSRGQGSVMYQPALDPRATELRLLPTGLTERAVITLTDLPRVRPR